MKAYTITFGLAFIGSLAAIALYMYYHKKKNKTADVLPATKPVA